MNKSNCALLVLLVPIYCAASSTDTHRYQPQQRSAEQNRLMGQQATHWYNPPVSTTSQQRPNRPLHPPVHRPPIHHSHQNNIYIDVEPEISYQTTETVNLPEGGVYTKTTDTVPLRRYPQQWRSVPEKRHIIQQGHYYVEQNE